MIEHQIIGRIFCEALDALRSEGIIDAERAEYSRHLFLEAEILILKQDSHQCSACTIHKPNFENGRWNFDRITIMIKPKRSASRQLYTIYHEIAHFLSIGKVNRLDLEVYFRPWGICNTIYRLHGKQMQSFVNQKYYVQNEKLTDCLACWLYTRIENETPYDGALLRRGEYASCDQEEIIKKYLENDKEKILDLR